MTMPLMAFNQPPMSQGTGATGAGTFRTRDNTVVRPPAASYAIPVPQDLMECFAAAFGDNVEVIGACRNLRHGRCSIR
jgi:hypothetical protein